MKRLSQVRVQWIGGGLMDYMRGLILVHQKLENIAEVISIIHPDHPISSAFHWACPELWVEHTDYDLKHGSCPQRESCTTENDWEPLILKLKENPEYITVRCLARPDYTDVARFKFLFTPNTKTCQDIDKQLSKYILGGQVFHLRLGDQHMSNWEIDSKMLTKAAETLNNFAPSLTEPAILLSDHPEIYNLVPDIFVPGSQPRHTGCNTMSYQGMIDMFTDLRIIMSAKRCIGINALPWGTSGFSHLPCAVHNIPYEVISLC